MSNWSPALLLMIVIIIIPYITYCLKHGAFCEPHMRRSKHCYMSVSTISRLKNICDSICDCNCLIKVKVQDVIVLEEVSVRGVIKASDKTSASVCVFYVTLVVCNKEYSTPAHLSAL